MQNLSKKIQQTRLFSDPQKVEIFVALETATDEDKKKLEAGIDAFDHAYAKTVAKHRVQIESILGTAMKDMTEEEKKLNGDAIQEMKLGLAFLTP